MEEALKKGDMVTYTQQHYKWLLSAGRWPNRRIPRRSLIGTVVWGDSKMVQVQWPHPLTKKVHFSDNMELL